MLVRVHASDDAADVLRETAIFFPDQSSLQSFLSPIHAPDPKMYALAIEKEVDANDLAVERAVADVRRVVRAIAGPAVYEMVDRHCRAVESPRATPPDFTSLCRILGGLWSHIGNHFDKWTPLILESAHAQVDCEQPLDPFVAKPSNSEDRVITRSLA